MQQLERRLGLFSVVTVSMSSMIGSGIFILPSIGLEMTGPSLFLAFALSSLIILPAAMGKAELAAAMPNSGGTYVYVERTLGPLFGTVAGLGLFLAVMFKASFALVGLGAYFSVISTTSLYPAMAISLSLIVIINILGVGKVSSILNLFFGLSIVGTLFLLGFSYSHWEMSHITPLFPNGYGGLADATALVFVSFAGVTKVAAIAEEIKDPEKNLPRGTLLSLFLVTVLYCGVAWTLSSVFPQGELDGEIRPIYVLAQKVAHPAFAFFMAIVAILTMVNTSNSGILAGSRFPLAMSKDRLLPPLFGRLHRKFLTPVASIVFSGIIIAIVVSTMDVVSMAKMASAFMIMIYLVENICVIILRETRPQWYNPSYKAPWYPVLQFMGIISTFSLLFSMGYMVLVAILFIVVPGVIFYFTYSARKTNRKGVLGIKSKRSELVNKGEIQQERIRQTDRRANVVVGLFGKEKSADMLVEMGVILSDGGHVEVASFIEIPEQTDLKVIVQESKETQSLRRRIRAMSREKNQEIHVDSIVTHDLTKAIYDIGRCVHCNWLLIEWRGWGRGALTIYDPIGWLKSHLDCHLVIYKDAGIRYIKNILVVFNEPQSDFVIWETSKHFSDVYLANSTFIKIVSKKEGEESSVQEFEDLISRFNHKGDVKKRILQREGAVQCIVDETINYDLLILGGEDHHFFHSLFGAMDDQIVEKAACSVMVLHASSRREE